MLTAREQAEQLRQQAINARLDERGAIEEMLKTLGYDGEKRAASKRRGRPPKQEIGEAIRDTPNQAVVQEEPKPPPRTI